MIVRIWRTEIDTARAAEYEEFALRRSLPMFREQNGFLGVVFAGRGAQRAVMTFWAHEDDVTALVSSPTYRATVDEIMATGLVIGPQSIEVLGVADAWLGAMDAAYLGGADRAG